MKLKTQIISIFLFILFTEEIKAQTKQQTFKNHYSIEAGRSISGTGDQGGVFISTMFTRQHKLKSHYSFGFGTSIHQNKGAYIYTALNGEKIDGTLRKIT